MQKNCSSEACGYNGDTGTGNCSSQGCNIFANETELRGRTQTSGQEIQVILNETYICSIPENATVGTTVLTIDTSVFSKNLYNNSFSIISGNEGEKFEMVPYTGNVHCFNCT